MKCPVCTEPDLLMSERQGIEIDYCPKCRGVWLDRGELDKLIEKAAPAAQAEEPYREPAPRQEDYRRGYDDHPPRGYYKKKRKGLLGEIFDFD